MIFIQQLTNSWKKKFEEMGEQGFDYGITKAKHKKIGELE